jgi:hypothetical protein
LETTNKETHFPDLPSRRKKIKEREKYKILHKCLKSPKQGSLIWLLAFDG